VLRERAVPGTPALLTARNAARRALDARGYRDWGIEIVPGTAFGAQRPCAEAAFDGVPVWPN
jgi:hypothetical protein